MDMNYIDKVAAAVEEQLDPKDRPSNEALSLYRLYALLALTIGVDTSLADVHDAWSVWMTSINPAHDALVPFSELSDQQKDEDGPYRNAIQRVAREISLRKTR